MASPYDSVFDAAKQTATGSSGGASPYDAVFDQASQSATNLVSAPTAPSSESPKPQGNQAVAFASGFNRLPANLLGMPADFVANMLNLGIAGYGTTKRMLGGPGTDLPDTLDKRNLPLTSDWFNAQMNKTPFVDPTSEQAYPTTAAVGSGVSAGMTGATSLPRALTQAAIGGGSGGLSSAVYQSTGDPAKAALAGLAVPASAASATGATRLALSPNAQGRDLAAKAEQVGIPVGPVDVSRNPLTGAARSAMSAVPIVNRISRVQDEAQQTALNQRIGNLMGIPDKDGVALTPGVINKFVTDNKSPVSVTNGLDRIWSNNDLQVTSQYYQKLQSLKALAGTMDKENANTLTRWVSDFESKIQPQSGTSAAVIDGATANNLQSALGKVAANRQGGLAEALTDLRKSTIDTFNAGLSPDAAAENNRLRGQYKVWKTIEPLMAKAEAGQGGKVSGDVPASQLPSAVVASYGDSVASRTNPPPILPLSYVASQVIPDRIAKGVGSVRSNIQFGTAGAASGLLGSGIATAFHAGGAPAVAAALPYTAGLGASAGLLNWGLGSPTVLRGLMAKRQAGTLGTILPISSFLESQQ